MRIILHIGQPKAGSSALQVFFTYNNRALFEKEGIGYFLPQYRYNPWKNQANAGFLQHYTLEKMGIKNEQACWTKEQMQDDISAFLMYIRRFSTLILSEEMLWNIGVEVEGFWPMLQSTIMEICGGAATLDVIVYLRRQDEWSASEWKQRVRSDEKNEDDFHNTIKLIEEHGYLDYENILRRIMACFGREHMIVRSYDDFSCSNTGIVRDFLCSAGLPFREEMQIEDRRIHPSYSLNLTEAIRLIKMGEVPYKSSLNALRDAAKKLFSNSANRAEFPMPYEERRDLLARYAEGNRCIAEIFLGREELFSDEIGDYEVWRPDPERDMRNARELVSVVEYYDAVKNGR